MILVLISQYSKFENLPAYTQIGSTGVYYRVFNRFVEVQITKTNVSVSNSGTTLATLPSSVPKPAIEIPWVVSRNVDSNTPLVNGYIETNGKVSAYSWASQSGVKVVGHVLYLA